MTKTRSMLAALLAAASLTLVPAPGAAQGREERSGVVLYWGVVPAEVVHQQGAAGMHGVEPKGGSEMHHLVIALFTSSGQRIADATVRATLREVGVVNAPEKPLEPMLINGQASFGNYFPVVMSGPYRFDISVQLPDRSAAVAFTIHAASPHRRPQ